MPASEAQMLTRVTGLVLQCCLETPKSILTNTDKHTWTKRNQASRRHHEVNTHLGIEQSRRDDLEAVGYVPWPYQVLQSGDAYKMNIHKKTFCLKVLLTIKVQVRSWTIYLAVCGANTKLLHVLIEVLMYFNRGSLPWQGLKANSKKEHLSNYMWVIWANPHHFDQVTQLIQESVLVKRITGHLQTCL